MTDQQRATASHLYGNTFCQTPSMERLAADGVLFENAITPHPLCVPARISFWTSQFPHSHGGRRNQTLMPADATHAWQLLEGSWLHHGPNRQKPLLPAGGGFGALRRVECLYPRRAQRGATDAGHGLVPAGRRSPQSRRRASPAPLAPPTRTPASATAPPTCRWRTTPPA